MKQNRAFPEGRHAAERLTLVYGNLEKRLEAVVRAGAAALLKGGGMGLEKESLRVTRAGALAQTPHPRALGSALTHPHITTDYSEALLELITPPYADVRETLTFLEDIHRFVYQNIGEEMLWATSMPCAVAGDESIPIAQYGSSNVGRMKHVYRVGLGHRYGRVMQAIAGVHFNFSMPEGFWPVFQELEKTGGDRQFFIADRYFGLIRNFQRCGWIIPYLFGASPAVCKSFLGEAGGCFAEFDRGTWYQPYATSLRMSDIGYKNSNQAGLNVSYNGLEEYLGSLTRAIETPFPPYQAIGVVVDGEYRQLNANVLQIENEYYSFIRPKQVTLTGEKPTLALKRRGVQYIEVRALDLSAYDPVGVNLPQLRFLEAFLVFCLLHDSPPMDEAERQAADQNQGRVACCGRDPALQLRRNSGAVPLRSWAAEICEAMQGVCEVLDAQTGQGPYSEALAAQREVVADPDRTPSARLLADMRASGEPFFHFARRMSRQHEEYFKSSCLSAEREAWFRRVAAESLDEQQAIEAGDMLSFQEYLERYLSQVP